MTVRSMFVGLTGLTAMGHGIDVISNNIANVNTTGFKAGRASFDDIFYQTLNYGQGATDARGGVNPDQIGYGVRMGSVDTIFTQGSSQTTGRLLDLAVEGNGFFVLKNGAGQEFLTRAGGFSLDNESYLVDPGSGYYVIGRMADENGVLVDDKVPLQIDFDQESEPVETTLVRAEGNIDSRIGDPQSDSSVNQVSYARSSTNLLGLFDDGGTPFGLVNGDVIQFETGFLELANPPDNINEPIDLTTSQSTGKANGAILTVTDTTTIEDLKNALSDFFNSVMEETNPGTSSDIDVTFDSTTGSFQFNNTGQDALSGIRIGVAPRENSDTPPAETSRLVGDLFVNSGDPDFTKTLNVAGETKVNTNQLREADTTTSIDVYDTQGNSHTVSVGLAADTEAPAAESTTLISELKDSEGRFLIPDGVVPPAITYSEVKLESDDNTAVYTATQVNNIVATQGVYSFTDANDNLIAIRLSDGAISFNGNEFNSLIEANGTINAEIEAAGLDITGDSFLNIPRTLSEEEGGTNIKGGLLGDEGFTESTTLEDIRSALENRINTSIQQVKDNLENLNGTNSNLAGIISVADKGGFAVSDDTVEIKVVLNDDGSFEFQSTGGSLGAAADGADETEAAALAAQAGGEDKLGMVLDLAALTRSVRVSTVSPGTNATSTADDLADQKEDSDYTDGGGVTGFIRTADPFGDLNEAFQIGNNDYEIVDADGNFVVDGDPRSNPPDTFPTGIDDSGVQLVALSSGTLSNADAMTESRFDEYQAFTPETSAFMALFNQQGYGIAQDVDNDGAIEAGERTEGVPIGVVAKSTDSDPFTTNTIHKDGTTRNTVNYQVVVPNDSRGNSQRNDRDIDL